MLRVLHAPLNIGNQPWVLSRHERKLGAASQLVVNHGTWLGYEADRFLAEPGDRSLAARLRRVGFGLIAPLRYDVLHYYFGQSFLGWGRRDRPSSLWFADLKLARRLGRKVFMTLQGCDVRLSDRSDAENEVTMCRAGHCTLVETCRAATDARRRGLIDRILPLADRIFVLNPELARFVPGAIFLPYACVDVEALRPVPPRTEGPITILHAPSDPSIKGTRLVVEAVERLARRHPIRLLQVTGLPHAEAMKLYPQADLVIDQVLAGWYGGFAVEMMALGKPVACYLRREDFSCLPPGMAEALPLMAVRPDTLEQDLEQAILRRAEWPAWGERSRQFTLEWHNPATLARAMIEAYRDPQSRFALRVS